MVAVSERVDQARQRAEGRVARRRARLRPLGWAVGAVVWVAAFQLHPRPGLHGSGAAVLAVLAVFTAALALAVRPHALPDLRVRVAVDVALGAAGVALTALQHRHATLALAHDGAQDVVASTLLCVVLALAAGFLRQASVSQDETELLYAQLEDARDAQAAAAAVAERGRIAGDLHDILAHSLSGAALQLQGARRLMARGPADPAAEAAVSRAAELVRDGLAEARRAVGALRGDAMPTIDHLAGLVQGLRDDLGLDVELRIEGSASPLGTEQSLALYRGAQEALTNAARYAKGAKVLVTLRRTPQATSLLVEDRRAPGAPAPPAAIAGAGGGHGLSGMRERIERAGGTMRAGPAPDGWRVELEVGA
jgi:signal transduction histidine kinase